MERRPLLLMPGALAVVVMARPRDLEAVLTAEPADRAQMLDQEARALMLVEVVVDLGARVAAAAAVMHLSTRPRLGRSDESTLDTSRRDRN